MENSGSLLRHEQVYLEHQNNPELPDEHREEYARALAIAEMFGEKLDDEGNRFDAVIIHSAEEIGTSPRVYLFETNEVSLARSHEIEKVDFEVDPKSLSGKVDAAHAVLPGLLTVGFEDSGPEESARIPIVVKGSFKREFPDRMERLKKEIEISRIQHQNDEIAFKPMAAVIAPPVNPMDRSRKPQNEILLLTLYESSAVSMDNAPWRLGFTEDNLEAIERAVDAVGRFNTTIGLHGDAKIKNIVQKPDGATSMIDFETSQIEDISDPVEAGHIAASDFGMLLDSLEKRGFFSEEPWRAFEVVETLGDIYLKHWADFSAEVEEAIYAQVVAVVEQYRSYGARPAPDSLSVSEGKTPQN